MVSPCSTTESLDSWTKSSGVQPSTAGADAFWERRSDLRRLAASMMMSGVCALDVVGYDDLGCGCS